MILSLLALLGCVNQTLRLIEVEVSGEVVAAAPEGPVALEFLYAWSGEGELRHPLEPIEARSLAGPGAFTHTLLYPSEGGEGLVLYAWMDRDGDGALCSPAQRDEPAGLLEVGEFPAFAVEVELRLEADCAGPESLFP